MDLTTAIVTIIVGILGGGGLWGFLAARGEREAKEAKQIEALNANLEQIQSDVAHVRNEFSDVKEELMLTKDLSLSNARDKLNYLNNKYIEKGYIPHREAIAYQLLGEAYINAGGNSEVATAFHYVMKNIPKGSEYEED